MANLDPWAYASKTRSEHAEQVALFMWANRAMRHGIEVAADPDSYNVQGYAERKFKELNGEFYLLAIPQLKWLHAISNHGAGFGRKAEGVKKGVADIFLPVPITTKSLHNEPVEPIFAGLYIELKRLETKGKAAGIPSPEQFEFQDDMREAGYKHEIVYGWELARDEICRYLGRMPAHMHG